MNVRSESWSTHLTSLLYLLFLGVLFSCTDRSNYIILFTLFSGSFAAYVVILYKKNIDFKYLVGVGIIAHTLAFLSMPNLSPDSYRFLWDGAITLMGENPFDTTPNELIHRENFANDPYISQLFDGITPLSRKNYTCYPTINQAYFVVANSFSRSITVNLFVLKLLILATQFVGLRYLLKLLEHFKLPSKRVFILALNPLWLIETVGNLHFEGVMLSFLLISFYFLVKQKWILAALFLAFAIHVKLIPLVLLPFLFRYLGWTKSSIVYILTALIVSLLALVYFREDNYMNFLASLKLYFQSFEFNSLIYHHYIEYGKDLFGFYPTHIYGERLSRWGTFFMLCLAIYGGKINFQTMATRMIFGMLIYYLFATTVHPWYIITILGISVFTRYSFGIIWSGLIFMTYAAYGDLSEDSFQLLVHIEYAILLLVVLYELIRKRPLLQFAT